MDAALYKLTFASGKSYVGLTTEGIATRLAGHRKAAFKKNSKLAVHNAWRKHGEPEVELLWFGDLELIRELEVDAIIYFGCRVPGGYNISSGGEVAPSKSPEARAKISANNGMRKPGVAAARSGEHHHMKTPEQRARARVQQTLNNNMNSAAAHKKSSESHKGKKHDEETKRKMSVSRAGRDTSYLHTAEVRQKRGAAISAGWARRAERLKGN